MRRWLLWSYTVLPDPLDLLVLTGDRDVDLQICHEVDAILTRRGSFEDPDTDDLFASREGLEYAVFLLFEKYHPELTFDEVRDLLPGADLEAVLQVAQGRFPKSETDVEEDYYRAVGLLPPLRTARAKSLDWAAIDQNLFENCYMTPAECDEMTLPEFVVCSRKPSEVLTSQAAHVARCYRSLTPPQLVELIRLKARFVY